MLVDSHCHLDFDAFDGEREEVIRRARAAGISRIVTICTRVAQFERVLAIAEGHEDIFCSVGTHPHNAGEEPDITSDRLVNLSRHPKVVAIGEAGLDYHYDHSPRQAQRTGLLTHIAAARQTGLPLVIHARDADDDMIALLEEEAGKGRFPFVLHCFSSGRRLAAAGVSLGGYISLSGMITFKNAAQLREIAAETPRDRLLVETDAPYLAPVPHRGHRNEPAFVAETAARLAAILGIGAQAVAELTTENFFRLFAKVPRPGAR